MGNLIAEQRPDKNGKVVTRHVKPEVAGKAARSLPAPLLSVPQAPKREPMDVIQEIFSARLEPEEYDGYISVMKGKSPETTQKIVVEALQRQSSDEEFAIIKEIIGTISDNGLVQIAVLDAKFVKDLSEAFESRDKHLPMKTALGLMGSVFTSKYRARGTREGMEADHTKHADMFRAAVLARAIRVDDVVFSDFDSFAQYQHIHENKEMLMKHLPTLRVLMTEVNDLHVRGPQPNSDTALEICGLLEEFPGADENIINMVKERERYNPEEIRDVLSGGSQALSTGAL